MNLKRWVRRWLNEGDSYAIACEPQPCGPEPAGTRANIVRIDNGWLLECYGTTRFVSELDDIPKELPGLITAGKMRDGAKTSRY